MAIPGAVGNITVFQGTDRIIQDTIYQSDGVTPQNVSGWNIAFTVYGYSDPTAIFFTKTTGDGTILVPDPTSGVLQILIYAADTTPLAPGAYQFKVERTDTGSDDRPTTGLFTVLP